MSRPPPMHVCRLCFLMNRVWGGGHRLMKDNISLMIGPIHMQSFLFCLHLKGVVVGLCSM